MPSSNRPFLGHITQEGRCRRRRAAARRMIRNRYRKATLWNVVCTLFPVWSAPVIRFDRLIRPGMIIRDVKQRFPETIPVFEQYRFRPACDDCDIESVARKNGLDSLDVVAALNQSAFRQKADTEHAGNQTPQKEAAP